MLKERYSKQCPIISYMICLRNKFSFFPFENSLILLPTFDCTPHSQASWQKGIHKQTSWPYLYRPLYWRFRNKHRYATPSTIKMPQCSCLYLKTAGQNDCEFLPRLPKTCHGLCYEVVWTLGGYQFATMEIRYHSPSTLRVIKIFRCIYRYIFRCYFCFCL